MNTQTPNPKPQTPKAHPQGAAPSRAFDWEDIHQRIVEASAALETPEISPEMLQRLWSRRAAKLAERPIQEDVGERAELLLVQLGRELYGMDVQHVRDIRYLERVTPVPRVPNWVTGVISWRGRILSVLDLQRYFGLPSDKGDGSGTSDAPAFQVVVETPGMEMALLVDDVLTVEALPTSRIQEATDTVRGLHPEYVHGVVAEYESPYLAASTNGDSAMLVVLDLPVLLADEGLTVHEEIV